MVHEATSESGRLTWMTERHVKPLYDLVRPLWRRLRKAAIAAPIDDKLFHYVLVGAASLVYVNAPEARLLTGIEPTARRVGGGPRRGPGRNAATERAKGAQRTSTSAEADLGPGTLAVAVDGNGGSLQAHPREVRARCDLDS